MAKATQDIWIDNPDYPGAKKRIAKRGQTVPDHYLKHATSTQVTGSATGSVVNNASIATDPDAGAGEPEGGAYDDMNVPDLKAAAKDRGIDGYGNMKKAELIEALEAADEADGAGE